jgi:hypothetical protein
MPGAQVAIPAAGPVGWPAGAPPAQNYIGVARSD